MRKGPLIAAGIQGLIGVVMIIIGAVFYDGADLTAWPHWVLWFGLVLIGIGLIVMVVAFIKKPSEETEPKKAADAAS